MFFCFIFFFLILGGHMESLCGKFATLGKIPTSTYFIACVAFSLERKGGGWGPFLPHSPRALYPPLLYPTTTTAQVYHQTRK